MINKVLRGADLICYINGNPIGEFTDLDYSLDYSKKGIYGIDNVDAFEIVPGQTKVLGKIGLLRIRGSAGLEGRGIVAPMNQSTQEKYMNISVIDRVLDLEILKIERAHVTAQQWSVSAKGKMTGSFNFQGILAGNEFDNIFS